jgi:hypothetical protein
MMVAARDRATEKKTEKKKGRGCPRPKSREETPKEGDGNAEALPHRNKIHRDAQNARAH